MMLALIAGLCLIASGERASARDWSDLADLFFKVVARDEAIPSAGLPRSVAQDEQGFVWIATDAGLARWDGMAFRTYTNDPAGGGAALPELMVNLLHRDRTGRLWIGMSSEGLLWHDAAADRFRRPANATPLDRAHIVAIADDDAGKGVWVGSDVGLAHVDAGDRVTLVGAGRGLPRGLVNAVVGDGAGGLWVGVDGRLFHRSTGSAAFAPVPLATRAGPAPQVTYLHRDRRNRIWISTDTAGFFLVAPGTGTIRNIPVVFAGETPVLGRMIDATPTTLWSASRSGIVAVDLDSLRLRHIAHDPGRAGSLPENTLTDLARDRSGLIWLAGDASVSVIDPLPKTAIGIVGALGRGLGTQRYDAWSVGAAPDGSLWYGSAEDPVSRLDPRRDAAGHPIAGTQKGALSFAFAGRHGTFIAGAAGLDHVLPDGRTVRRLTDRPLTRLRLHGTTLYIGGDNSVATLDVRDPSRLRPLRLSQRLTDGRVRSLLIAPDGALWIGTARGLNRVVLATGQVTQFLADAAQPDGIRSNFVSSLLFDPAGRLWVGTTGGGLTVLQGRNMQWKAIRHLGRRDGLLHDTVDSILPARDGGLWISTDAGIVRIDPRDFAIRRLHAADGVAFLANWTSAGTILPDGRLVFGSFGGLTLIDPNGGDRTQAHIPLRFTAIVAGGRTTGNRDAVVMPAGADRSLTVEFARLDYLIGSDTLYAYRLSGFEAGWTHADALHRVARYTNLPPGAYTLELRATGRDGRLDGDMLRLPVQVRPNWHETALFKLAMLILTLLALAALMNLRMRTARRRQLALEGMIATRTAELQSSQRALEKLAYSDALTGLGNRRRYNELLAQMLADPDDDGFGLLLIDLDRFKQVNDQFGHDVGDALLVEVAARLTANVRDYDHVFRLGGDEFVILAPGLTRDRALGDLCDRLIHAFTAPTLAAGRSIRTALSIGATLSCPGASTAEALYKAADRSLYEAKNAGRGTWCLAVDP